MFAIQENIRAALNAGNLALSLTTLLSGFEINNIGAQVSALVWKVNCHLLIASAVFLALVQS